MRLRSTASAIVILLATCLPTLRAAAQSDTDSRDGNYFAAELLLGVVGSAGVGGDDDTEPTFGGGVAYMVPLHRYFGLGGRLAVLWWRTKSAGRDLDADRNVTGDLTFVAQGRLPLTHDVELYLSLPIGPALDFANEYHLKTVNGGSIDADPALGLSFSILAGARFALGDSFGVLAEAGYMRHSFSHDVTLQTTVFGAAERTRRTVDIDLEQLAVNVGFWF